MREIEAELDKDLDGDVSMETPKLDKTGEADVAKKASPKKQKKRKKRDEDGVSAEADKKSKRKKGQ
jgi:hypothetical protein